MAASSVSLEVTNDHAVPIEPLGGTATVLNASGDTLFYADNPQVSSVTNQGSLTAGQSATFASPAWMRSASLSTVTVTTTAFLSGGRVDMCAAPFGCVPGADVTVALQAAINAANATGLDTTILFSQPGVYRVNGPMLVGQSATTPAVQYQGQVLFPARAHTNGAISIRIMGLSPSAGWAMSNNGEPEQTGGVVLLSNAGAAVSTTTTAQITSGASVTSIAVAALPNPIPAGVPIAVINGTTTQIWWTSGAAAAGATTISVNATSDGTQTAGSTFPVSSTVNYGGFMFDAIAGENIGVGTPSTDIHVTFENITLRMPGNPQSGAVNGNALVTLVFRGSNTVDTPTEGTGVLTGAAVGVRWPPFDNFALVAQEGDMQILGFPINFEHSEHFQCDNLYSGMGIIGCSPSAAGGLGHSVDYKRLIVQGCWICMQPNPTGGNVHAGGLFDIGDGAGGAQFPHLNWVVYDPGSQLWGELTVQQWSTTNQPGFPVSGATNLRFKPYNGRYTEWPSDEFYSLAFTSTQNYIGTTTRTHHKWVMLGPNAQESYFTRAASGPLNANTNAPANVPQATLQYRTVRPQPSRVVRTVLTPTGGSTQMYVFQVLGIKFGTQTGMVVLCNGNQLLLQKLVNGTGTTLASAAASSVTSGVQILLDTVITATPGRAPVFNPLINGVPVLATVQGAGSLEQFTAFLTAATGTGAITSLTVAPLAEAIPNTATVTVYQGSNTLVCTTSAAAAAGATTIAISSITPGVSYLPGCPIVAPTGGYIPSAAEVSAYQDTNSATWTQDGVGFWKDSASTIAFFGVSPL